MRDEEWLVRSVVRTNTDGWMVKVIGTSEFVRDQEATFFDACHHLIHADLPWSLITIERSNDLGDFAKRVPAGPLVIPGPENDLDHDLRRSVGGLCDIAGKAHYFEIDSRFASPAFVGNSWAA